ncbi:beta-propeller fold lactonase family protein [Gemella sp. GH3]|nr:beta-propeller fold lactonase family protein [Gemella sp. GH3.1]NYS51135.1 beta-propeller fold lactonase family protein [Gemella sp. GH3]
MIEKFYLGTYTKRKSEGIYSIKLNKNDKTLFDLKLEKKINNPTYITKNNDNIFSVSSNNNLGGITVFDKYNTINENFESSTPCYISYNHNNNIILTANYHTGTIIAYRFKNDKLVKLDVLSHEQESHMHYCKYTPDNKFIVTCDLGTDKLITYVLENDKLKKINEYKATSKSGPRHIAFHKTKNIAYLICELNASVEILNYDNQKGKFSLLNKINLVENNEHKWASAIRITSDSKYLYTTNRGKNIITALKILDNGDLVKIASYDTLGEVPRDFNFSNDEKFIIVGHQETDNLTIFERNKEDGTLKAINNETFAPEVVCIIK